jgi:hypothetical protein
MITMCKVSLILTSNQQRRLELIRFLDGLSVQTTHDSIALYFVNQAHEILDYNWDDVGFTSEIIPSGKLGLSAARNLALSHLKPLDDSLEIIGFPDDDCWYKDNVLKNIINYFKANPDVDCICTNVFDPSNQKSYGGRPLQIETEVTFSNIFKLPISVGIFIKRDSFIANQIHFDERLGAGTKLGSGEETELIGRLLESNCRVKYVGAIQVYHPVVEYDQTDVIKYYKYANGFGHLIASFVKRGHLTVIPYLLETLTRSLLGVVIYIFDPVKFKLYLGRMLGIVFGLVKGVTNLDKRL